MLWNLCIIMQNRVAQEQLRLEAVGQQDVMLQVLDSADISVVVSDLETNAILWSNELFKRQCPVESGLPHPQKCHEATPQTPERCQFCFRQEVPEEGGSHPAQVGHVENENGGTSMVYNSLIDWPDHGRALISYSVDTTESNRMKRQLEYLLSVDPLTKADNRSAMMRKFAALLAEAEQRECRLSIAFVDVDGLKLVNHKYGMEQGDALLASVVTAIRECIRSGDVIGRVNDDEFVVLFQGCGARVANARLLKARVLLQKLVTLQAPDEASFSFGTVEHAPGDGIGMNGQAYMDHLLQQAILKMQAARAQPAEDQREAAR